jgi:hypothetical protein
MDLKFKLTAERKFYIFTLFFIDFLISVNNLAFKILAFKIYNVRFEDFTAVAVKNAAFWDINTQFVLHKRNITFPLQSPASKCHVRFEVFTAVTMKNAIFWDINTQFVPHRIHITSPLQSSAG